MKLIIADRTLSDTEKQRIQQDSSVCRVFRNRSIPKQTENDQTIPGLEGQELQSLNKELLKSILEFGDRKIDGTPFSEFFTFKTAGLWYYHKFRIFYQVKTLMTTIREIQNIIEPDTYEEILIFTENRQIEASGFLGKEVRYVYPEVKRKRSVHFKALFFYSLTVVIRYLYSLFNQSLYLKDKEILVIDSIRHYRRIFDPQTGKDKLEDAFLGPFTKKYSKEIGLIDQLLIPKFSDPFRITRNNFINHAPENRIFSERIFLHSLLNFRVLKKWKADLRLLQSNYRKISSDTLDSVERLFFEAFKRLHASSKYYVLKYHVYRHYFKRSKAKILISIDENSPNFKIIHDAAKSRGITTIGYQHGLINEDHLSYTYSECDFRHRSTTDYFFTWGKKWRNRLIEKGFSSESIKTIGQLRTDYITGIKSLSESYRKSYTDKGFKHLVLFASQPQKDEKLRYRAAQDVFTAIRNIPDSILLLKMHPHEKDKNYYLSIANACGCENIEIIEDTDLYLTIGMIDVAMTCFSTVGYEVMYFYKPLILVDHLKQDILDLHKNGIALQATNPSEIENHLRKLIGKNFKIDREKYDKSIEEMAFRIDAGASQRFWESLMEIKSAGPEKERF